jgi:hypothetical protein
VGAHAEGRRRQVRRRDGGPAHDGAVLVAAEDGWVCEERVRTDTRSVAPRRWSPGQRLLP